MTKKIIENIPILTAIIIVLGVLKLSLYYQNFLLPIKYFVTVSEIASTITDDLLLLFFYYFALKAGQQILVDTKLTFSIFSSADKKNMFYSIIFLFVNVGLFIWGFLETRYYLKIFITALTYYFFFTTFLQTKFARDYFETNKDLAFILFYFATAAVNIVGITSREIKDVSQGKYKGTKIVTNDTTYISTDTSYYVGQTDKYLFIYNSRKFCTVIPNSNIKRIELVVNEKK